MHCRHTASTSPTTAVAATTFASSKSTGGMGSVAPTAIRADLVGARHVDGVKFGPAVQRGDRVDPSDGDEEFDVQEWSDSKMLTNSNSAQKGELSLTNYLAMLDGCFDRKINSSRFDKTIFTTTH